MGNCFSSGGQADTTAPNTVLEKTSSQPPILPPIKTSSDAGTSGQIDRKIDPSELEKEIETKPGTSVESTDHDLSKSPADVTETAVAEDAKPIEANSNSEGDAVSSSKDMKSDEAIPSADGPTESTVAEDGKSAEATSTSKPDEVPSAKDVKSEEAIASTDGPAGSSFAENIKPTEVSKAPGSDDVSPSTGIKSEGATDSAEKIAESDIAEDAKPAEAPKATESANVPSPNGIQGEGAVDTAKTVAETTQKPPVGETDLAQDAKPAKATSAPDASKISVPDTTDDVVTPSAGKVADTSEKALPPIPSESRQTPQLAHLITTLPQSTTAPPPADARPTTASSSASPTTALTQAETHQTPQTTPPASAISPSTSTTAKELPLSSVPERVDSKEATALSPSSITAEGNSFSVPTRVDSKQTPLTITDTKAPNTDVSSPSENNLGRISTAPTIATPISPATKENRKTSRLSRFLSVGGKKDSSNDSLGKRNSVLGKGFGLGLARQKSHSDLKEVEEEKEEQETQTKEKRPLLSPLATEKPVSAVSKKSKTSQKSSGVGGKVTSPAPAASSVEKGEEFPMASPTSDTFVSPTVEGRKWKEDTDNDSLFCY